MTESNDLPLADGASEGAGTDNATAKPARAPRRRKAPAADSASVGATAEGSRQEATTSSRSESVDATAAPANGPTASDGGGGSASPHLGSDSGDGSEARSAGDRDDDSSGGEFAAGDGDGPRSRRRNRRDRRRGEGRPPGASVQLFPPNFEGPLPLHLQPVEPPQAGGVFEEVVSGAFDVAVEAPVDDDPGKRILPPDRDAPKLHKVLAQAGVGSRRDMEDMILEGRITVNGEAAHTGQRVSFGDRVEVDGQPVRLRIVPPPARIIAYHKPVGEIVTHDDPENRPTVFRRLPRLPHGKWQSVGRLDINTEGLLLFTNSGGLANQLMHPRFGVEREYAVRVVGSLGDEARGRLLEGVEVDGQRAAFRSIEAGGGEGLNQWHRVVITEGRNREVRKLFEAVGLTVSRLIRIRYGSVVLPHGLKRGVWVDLDDNDVRAIRRLASGPAPERGNETRREGGGKGRDERPPPRQDRQERPRPQQNAPRRPEEPRAEVARPAPERDSFDADMEDFDPASIPNPLQQTFDHRFVQGRRIGPNSGFGAGGSAPRPLPAELRGGGPKQPDPLQTSVGYIGTDAFHRKSRGQRNNRGGGGQGGGGQGGGGYGGGGQGGGQGGGGQGGGQGGYGGKRGR